MAQQTRIGRYHGSGSWPPALDVILREVHRVYRRRGYFNDPKEFRGVCTGADSIYTKGAADDCMRLLKDAGVLIPWKVDDKTHLLIGAGARQDLVTRFKQGLSPDYPPRDELARRAHMLLKSLRKRSTKSRTKTQSAIAPVAASASPTAAVDLNSTSVPSSQPTETSMTAMAPAPAVSAGATAKSVPRQRFVAYLPPGAARDVWLWLYVRVTKLKEFGARIAVPNGKLPDGVECSTAEFDEWFETFVRAGVIERLGESGGDNDAFRFLINPDEIHTVEIKERKRIKTPKVWVEVADRARREIEREALATNRLRNQLAAWVEANFPALHGLTASQKLMGYRPDATRTDTNWGIFYKDPIRDVYLPCLPGLEPYELVPTDFVARRCKRKKGKGIKPIPAPEPVIESAVEPVVEEPAPVHVDPPARERGDEPEPVPTVESERLVESTPEPQPAPIATARQTHDTLEQIERELARLEEAKRLLTARRARKAKRDRLATELAELNAQIVADDARLAELGFPVPKED